MTRNNIPVLISSTTGRAIQIFQGDQKILTFTLKDTAGAVVDLSAKTATDFKLTARQDFGEAQLFQVSGAFVTDGTDGKIKFTLTATELTTTLEDAILEIVDNSSGVQATLYQRRFDVLDDIQT